jgi:outer membrane protein TolC
MLKITLHDTPEGLRFQLEGALVGPWVNELEQCWRTAASIRGERDVQLDLREVTFIDDAGKELLRRLRNDGVQFVARGAMTSAIVKEVQGAGKLIDRLIHLSAMFVALGLMAPSVLGQDSALKLSLKDAVQLALKQNPQVAIANLNIAEAKEGSIAQRSALLPQVELSAFDAVRRANIQALIGKALPGFPQHVGPFYVIQAGPNLSAPLFDLTLFRRYKASRQDIHTAEAQLSAAREENVMLVVSQYLGSLRAAADVKAAQSRVELAKALFDLSSDLQRKGVGTRIDTLRAEVQYQNERQRLIQSHTQLETSLYALSRLLNLDPRQRIELVDEVSFFNTPGFDAERNLEAAYAARPEMRALESRIRSLELARASDRDQRLPRLSIEGGWNEQGLTPSSMIPAYNYQVDLNVPLFTGGRIKAQTAIADIEIKKADQDLRDLKNRIALDLKTAGAQLDAARNEVDVANRGVELAREEVTQARDRFQSGVANNIEVITAQDELARANDNQIVALYRYNQARADLAHATGRMETLYSK